MPGSKRYILRNADAATSLPPLYDHLSVLGIVVESTNTRRSRVKPKERS
jgi:hypothetical protein